MADELVAHNGDKYDMPWLKGRCIHHGVSAVPVMKTVDTLQWAKRHFRFNSNKLDYIARFLGLGHKLPTEFGLSKAIYLDRNKKALQRMVTYYKRDVTLLQQVYEKMALYAPAKTQNSVLLGGSNWACPRCASENVKVSKTLVSALGTARKQMQCKACGGYYSISLSAYKAYREATA